MGYNWNEYVPIDRVLLKVPCMTWLFGYRNYFMLGICKQGDKKDHFGLSMRKTAIDMVAEIRISQMALFSQHDLIQS